MPQPQPFPAPPRGQDNLFPVKNGLFMRGALWLLAIFGSFPKGWQEGVAPGLGTALPGGGSWPSSLAHPWWLQLFLSPLSLAKPTHGDYTLC